MKYGNASRAFPTEIKLATTTLKWATKQKHAHVCRPLLHAVVKHIWTLIWKVGRGILILLCLDLFFCYGIEGKTKFELVAPAPCCFKTYMFNFLMAHTILQKQFKVKHIEKTFSYSFFSTRCLYWAHHCSSARPSDKVSPSLRACR